MKSITIILLVLIVLSSCKKSGRGYVDGHVYEAGTKAPIPGVKIMLVSYRTSESALGQTATDANGYFKINYTKTAFPNYSYYLFVQSAEGYYFSGHDKYIENKKENKEYYFTPIAYAKFHVINNTANNYTLTVSNDEFYKSTTLTGSPFENKILPNYLEVAGNATTTIKWNYLNINHFGDVTVNQKHDTVVYTITLN